MNKANELAYWMESAAWWRVQAIWEDDDTERRYCLKQAFNALKMAWACLTA